MNPRDINISDYSYSLPEEKIARHPLPDRDASKLLIYRKGEIEEDTYKNISTFIPDGSLLVFNNTRVVPVRMIFKTATNASVEVFCLEPGRTSQDIAAALQQKGSSFWKCMVGNAAKWKNETLTFRHHTLELSASLIEKEQGQYKVLFEWKPEKKTFAQVLELIGQIPIPPYLKRESELSDEERYQTVYAKKKGSVAAPTAGLHFTSEVLHSLLKKKCQLAEVTLHVGAGTFKPVKTDRLEKHAMHTEEFIVTRKFVQQLISCAYDNTPIIAVGTTSLRTIESLYWMGARAEKNDNATLEELEIGQWDAYRISTKLTATQALSNLSYWMLKNNLETLTTHTQILIAPPYQLKIANALVTNFHQPNSTLLLLVAAIVGDDWKKIYDYALEHDFRFLSYGDGSVLFPQ